MLAVKRMATATLPPSVFQLVGVVRSFFRRRQNTIAKITSADREALLNNHRFEEWHGGDYR